MQSALSHGHPNVGRGSASPPFSFFHATAMAALAPKGTAAASSSRATWTADHLPPRAAGMPRLHPAAPTNRGNWGLGTRRFTTTRPTEKAWPTGN